MSRDSVFLEKAITKRLIAVAVKKLKGKLLFLAFFIFFVSIVSAQESIAVSGRVTDGESLLSNVSVKVEGSERGTTTDSKGYFNIVAQKGKKLFITYVGYENYETLISENTFLNIIMRPTLDKELENVVVIGYGTRKKVNLSGAVSTVSSKELDDRPLTSVSSALQGTMSGVTVMQDNGQPGKDQGTIRVRGIGTLSNSDAMVVVDGVVSSMNDINPNDIESITVLKDAASASIYGSRASNGVILVTTKKGRSGTVINYNGYIGKQQATRLPDFVPSWKAATFYNEALMNEGKPARYTNEEIEKFKDGSDPDNYPNTDWLDLFYKGSGLQQSHYINVNSGNEKTQSLFSLGCFNQDGLVNNTGLSRYTTRFKISNKLGERFTVNGNISYNLENFTEPTNPYTRSFAGMLWQINRIGRNVPYKYSNGYYGYYDDGSPMAWLESGSTNKNRTHYLRGIADADLEIIKGLHFKPLLGYRLDINQSKSFIKDLQYYNHTTGDPTFYQGPNSLTEYNNYLNVITLQGLLQYDKTFRDHDLTLLAGYSQEYTSFNYLQGFRKDFLNNSLRELNAGPVPGQTATGSSYETALQSFFGRINYEFKDRYLVEANIRYDGSSRFAPGNRWGTYPSFSAAWRISEEPFFSSFRNTMSELKIRGSWGILGNQNIVGNYPYISTIASGQNYTFGNSVASGVAPVNGANPDIHWEDTRSTNFGLDATLLDRKITFTIDYFVRTTNRILLDIPIGFVYGFNAPVQNAGNVQNSGIEFDLAYHGSSNEFHYDISANASFIKNTIKDLKGTDPIISDYSFLKTGYPINSFYGYEAEGIFQTEEQINSHAVQSGGAIGLGDIMYKDQNKDGTIDGDDRVYLGTYFPKGTYGATIALRWKGFDFSLFLQGAAGVKGFVRGELMGMVSDKYGKPTAIFDNHWTSSNPTNEFPRLWSSNTQNDPMITPSSFWVRDAGYLRVKNVQVGYTLNNKLLNKAGIEHIKIYYSGQNIFTASSFYKWVDPEAPAGARGTSYPQVLVNTVGVNITF
ncbi:TonB-dependent receptor [Agriterribacter sp.]|uniref:SusC/RagA family TonB-linked outer membrane protein n=1 Tax=Agriterribacter sp. TaxID=2821509 RepID=UPI002B526DD2|nr:TonB-dependent receptor [Agriterribacter sp.]HTN07356.1 TonB-dependent receptor [Agriterribacter sp.]